MKHIVSPYSTRLVLRTVIVACCLIASQTVGQNEPLDRKYQHYTGGTTNTFQDHVHVTFGRKLGKSNLETAPTRENLADRTAYYGGPRLDDVHHRPKRFAFPFDPIQVEPTHIAIPENVSLSENLLFWETLVCPQNSVCDPRHAVNHSHTCSPYWCESCSCCDCDKRTDCCIDKTLETTNLFGSKLAYMSCRPGSIKISAMNSYDEKLYYFIDKCPASYQNIEEKRSCEIAQGFRDLSELMSNVPVYSKITQLNYMNKHCARCHGENNSTEIWQPEVRCSSLIDLSKVRSRSDLFHLALADDTCYIGLSPPSGSLYFECESHLTIVKSCNVTGLWSVYDEDLVTGCQLYEHVIDVSYKRYRNIFCAFCNGLRMTDIIQTFDDGFVCTDREIGDIPGVSFSILFNLRENRQETVSIDTVIGLECPGNSVYIPYLRTCRELACSKCRLISSHTCVQAFKSATGVGYKVQYDLLPDLIPLNLSTSASDIWFSYLYDFQLLHIYKRLREYSAFAYLRMDVCYRNVSENTSLVYKVRVEFKTVFGSDLPPVTAELILLELYKLTWKYDDVVWTAQESLFQDADGSMNASCETFGLQLVGFDSVEHFPEQYILSSSPYIHVGKFSSCNQIFLNPAEYEVDDGTGDLRVIWSNETLAKTEYLVINGTVHICVNFSGWYEVSGELSTSHPNTADTSMDDTEIWLTLVSLSLSMVGLVLTFIVCILHKARHSVPGKITIIFVVTLFSAQLLLLVSGYVKGNLWPCRLVGLATHYFWLAVFCWKNLAAYHMHAVFIKPFQHACQDQPRTLLIYCLYGFGVPLAVVVPYTVTRILLSNSDGIGYGDGACFLPRPIDVGLAFVLPVGVVLTSNAYFFGRSVYVIRKMSDMEKSSNRSNTRHVSLYIKMSLVLGFTWILGFFANLINTPYLWYVFIVLNGGSGVLIFFIHVCKKNILRLQRKGDKPGSYSESETARRPVQTIHAGIGAGNATELIRLKLSTAGDIPVPPIADTLSDTV